MAKRDIAYMFALRTWHNLNRRTVNGTRPDYKTPQCARYLARGIELRFDRSTFFEWCISQAEIIWNIHADEKRPSLDRIDGESHYELSNLRIISTLENSHRKKPGYKNRVTQRLNSLPVRYCKACGKILTRNQLDQDKSETAIKFKRRSTCNIQCRARYLAVLFKGRDFKKEFKLKEVHYG